MNKKILGVFISLLVVAVLALPMSLAFAEKPTITMTLSGTYYMVGGGSMKVMDAGQSCVVLIKIKDLDCVWTGDITAGSLGPPPVPGGVYNGQWSVRSTGEGVAPGRFILEDVTIAGRSGDLTIGAKNDILWIESGTGELSSIRGKGTNTFISEIVWGYEFEVQINP